MNRKTAGIRRAAGICAALAVAAALLTAGVSPAAADGSGPYSGKVLTFRDSSDTNTALGMWVWDIRVIVGDDPRVDMDAQLLLDMLAKNHFTEIYLGCAYLMDDEQVAANGGVVAPGYVGEDQLRSFIASCSAIGVRVSLLTATSGDAAYDWWDASLGYAETAALISRAAAINARASADSEKLYGIHIDLEPDWDHDRNGQPARAQNLQSCADYVTAARAACDAQSLEFALDINAWMGGSTDTVLDETGAVVPLMDVLTRKCQSLAIMAYRNSAQAQYEIAADEIAFATVNGCQIMVGAECAPRETLSDPWYITYDSVGADAMIAQLNALRALLDESGCAGYGAAIHDSYAFYRLMTMPDAAQIAAQPNVGDADDWQTDNIVADRAALGVPASAAAGTDTVYAGSFDGIYTHQRLYVDLVVESGACARVTVNFSSDGVPAAAVAIHEKFGYADGLPAGRYTGYVNLEKWVPFGAVCGGTAVQVTGSGSLTIQAFRLVDASAAALPADIYTATDGNTFRVTQVTADAQALGLPAGDISVLPDSMNSDEWYHEPVVQPLYHTGCYLAVDLTVNQGQGGDAQVPVIVRFGNRDAGTMNIELHTLLGCPRGLRPGSYKLLVDIGAYLPQMEDGTNYFGTIIERRGLYGGNITVRQFALVTAQRVERPDASQLYTGLDGVPYLVHERVGRAALNIPAGPLNQNNTLYGPANRIACGTATHLVYDFTVYERTLYIDVRFDGDREAGNIHFDRVLRGGGGLPPGHYRGVIPLEGTVYHNALGEIEGLYLANPEGGYITVDQFALVTVTPYDGGFVPIE